MCPTSLLGADSVESVMGLNVGREILLSLAHAIWHEIQKGFICYEGVAVIQLEGAFGPSEPDRMSKH